MTSVRITVNGVSKEFNRRKVFDNVNFEISNGHSIAITGPNGSGKSTLVRIVAKVLSPTRGRVHYYFDGANGSDDMVRDAIGFVSPYLQLYDEFSALENLMFLNRIRLNSRRPSQVEAEKILAKVNLAHRKDDLVRGFSSGMKQRLKYALALSHSPAVLILDEPTANLDDEGTAVVRQIVREQTERGILILATNSAEEAAWCEQKITLK